eukprot:Skav220788  [mRNA]  locus=scaffold3887:25177:27540:- [translate_table: standard]
MKPVTEMETMSPARALFTGSRVTPSTTVISFTFPEATISPSKLLQLILSPFWICPLWIFPVTVGPKAGSLSNWETSMENPLFFSSTARISGSTTAGSGGGTTSRMVSYSATMSVGRLSDLASSSERAQKPALPEA